MQDADEVHHPKPGNQRGRAGDPGRRPAVGHGLERLDPVALAAERGGERVDQQRHQERHADRDRVAEQELQQPDAETHPDRVHERDAQAEHHHADEARDRGDGGEDQHPVPKQRPDGRGLGLDHRPFLPGLEKNALGALDQPVRVHGRLRGDARLYGRATAHAVRSASWPRALDTSLGYNRAS